MVDQPSVPPGAVACWQAMTRLHITNRVDAIEYLRSAVLAARLSAAQMRGLLRAFPVMPAGPTDARVDTRPDPQERGRGGDPGGDRRAGSTPTGHTGPDVLACAASILPAMAGARPCSVDVHLVLFEAVCRLGAGSDRYERLRLAEETRDMFAAYLVTVGQARPRSRPSAAVRGWVVFQDFLGVQLGLAGAAGYWRAVLTWDEADAAVPIDELVSASNTYHMTGFAEPPPPAGGRLVQPPDQPTWTPDRPPIEPWAANR